MNDFKFSLDRKGVSDLLRGEAMQAGLKAIGKGIASRSGDGYEADLYVGKKRANVSVRTKSRDAVLDNNENNTLLKNLR